MPDRMPKPGTITPIADGAVTLQFAEVGKVFRLSVVGHRCQVEALPDVDSDTIAVPAPGSMDPPRYADGRALPPFDEVPILQALTPVPRATLKGVISVAQNPFGARAWHYTFLDGQLQELRLIEDVYDGLKPALAAPDGVDVVWRTDWESWRLWRSGALAGEQFLERSVMQSSWPYIALAQGLFEHDAFVEARQGLTQPEERLDLLRLLEW